MIQYSEIYQALIEIRFQTEQDLPCRYKEYKIVDTPLNANGKSRTMKLIRSTNDVFVKTEQFVYPFSSFLAEFGGALGLFLGFSFMWMWDVLQIFVNFFFENK